MGREKRVFAPRRRGVVASAASWTTLLLTSLILVPSSQAQDCAAILGDAGERYTTGDFDEAITLLSPCIRSFDPGTENDRAAHRLLALAYLRNDEIEEARLVIVELFARNPGYEADPVGDPPAFVSLVNLVREETGARPSVTEGGGSSAGPLRTWFQSPRNWLLLAGGSAAAAALIIISASSGGDGPEPLPMPPAFP